MKNSKTKKIIYVNFAPYENAGKILDFFLENFRVVILFSFSFHRLKKKKDANRLIIYINGRVYKSYRLFDYQFPEKYIFLFLPIRSTLILIQILFYSFYLSNKYGVFEYYFTVNAYTAWVGNILRRVRIVKKTIFWVWDYYPPKDKSIMVTFIRNLYWHFDKLATKSDKVVFLNRRIANLRQKIGEINSVKKYKIIPIGTNPKKFKSLKITNSEEISLVFLGVIKKSQGLDIFFDNIFDFKKLNRNIHLHIIGDGPDADTYMRKSTSGNVKVTFHGFLTEKQIQKILLKSHVGIACYVPSRSNVSYYGDPSKIKKYFSYSIPVITTSVFEFSKVILENSAGIIIRYDQPKTLVDAINKIVNNLAVYRKNAHRLSQLYNYKKIYKDFFQLQ